MVRKIIVFWGRVAPYIFRFTIKLGNSKAGVQHMMLNHELCRMKTLSKMRKRNA
jgi:hypothetical protein